MSKITTDIILGLLAAKHKPPEWAFLCGLRCGTGYGRWSGGRRVRAEVERTLDAWAINHYPGKLCQRVTYEIKISKSDFTAELRQPLKRRPGLLYSNLFYFVAPDGVVTPEKVPIECGLLVVQDGKYGFGLWEVTPAVWRDTKPPPWYFVSALARRAS